ncbi:MAG: EamA family transporter [Deltaproteobacteria bacterium]|nr:EamA family transporter [Deltaproteobacteria bacterium]
MVIEIGLDSFPPILFSALRFLCAAFPAILFWNKGDIKWRWIISIGITLGIVMFSLLYIGMYIGMPAGLSSLVLQIQAVFTLLLSSLILRDTPTLWQKAGITTAFLGLGLLVINTYETASFVGLIFVIASGFAWAVSNILMKLCGNINMFRLIIWISIIPPIPLFLISLLFETGHVDALSEISWAGVGSILYTGLVSTVLAFAIWGKLFREYSPNVVAPFALLVPIFGIASSFVILNERFTQIELLSTCLVFVGLALIVFGSKLSEFVRLKANYVFRK